MVHEVTNVENGLPYRNSVGICLFNRDGLVFLAERRDTPGAWQMPQGGIQVGEDPDMAVFRELKEETGVANARLLDKMPERLRYEFPDYLQNNLGAFRGKYRGQEQLWYALLFLGTDEEIDISAHDENEQPEFMAWRWERLAHAPEIVVDFKRPVYEKVAARFAAFATKIEHAEGQFRT